VLFSLTARIDCAAMRVLCCMQSDAAVDTLVFDSLCLQTPTMKPVKTVGYYLQFSQRAGYC